MPRAELSQTQSTQNLCILIAGDFSHILKAKEFASNLVNVVSGETPSIPEVTCNLFINDVLHQIQIASTWWADSYEKGCSLM